MSDQLVRNLPSKEGEALGEHLARITEIELARLRQDFPNHKEPCGTCAFRRGTFPNRCSSTVMDALKCVMQKEDFRCHEDGKLCCGWMIAMKATAELPPMKAPWDYSLTGDQKQQLNKK